MFHLPNAGNILRNKIIAVKLCMKSTFLKPHYGKIPPFECQLRDVKIIYFYPMSEVRNLELQKFVFKVRISHVNIGLTCNAIVDD